LQDFYVGLMAVVGQRHARHIMAFQGGPPPPPSQHAILTAAVAVPYYQVVPPQDVQPDRPIGYGAFGVVWWVLPSKKILFLLSTMNISICTGFSGRILLSMNIENDLRGLGGVFCERGNPYVLLDLHRRRCLCFTMLCVTSALFSLCQQNSWLHGRG